METDITQKVTRLVKFGAVGLVAIALAAAGAVYVFSRSDGELTFGDAKITGVTVGVRARTDGKIVSVDVNDGQRVEPGTVLVRVAVNVTEEDIAELEQNLELAKSNLAEIKKGQTITVPVVNPGAAAANSELAAAEARLQRMEELLAMGAVSRLKRDEAAAAYEAARIAASQNSVTYETRVQPSPPEVIESATLVVHQAEAALANAKSNREATDITAPVAGQVGLTEFAAGSDIKAGDTVVTINDADNIWLEIRTDDAKAARIAPGQFAEYKIDGKTYSGTVTSVEKPSQTDEVATEGKPAVPSDGSTVVKISLPGQANFAIGQQATVTINVG